MKLSYHVDEGDAIRYAQKHSGLGYQAIESAYGEVGGYQGYNVCISDDDDDSNPFVKAIQAFMFENKITMLDVIQDH